MIQPFYPRAEPSRGPRRRARTGQNNMKSAELQATLSIRDGRMDKQWGSATFTQSNIKHTQMKYRCNNSMKES